MSLRTKYQIFFILIFNAISTISWAANTQKPVLQPALKTVSEQWLRGNGAVRGGVSESYMSLYDIRKSASQKLKTERLILDWGDAIGRPATKGGYYQVEYQEKSHRLIINMALTLNSKIEGKVLTDRLSKGLYIKQAQLEFDRISQSQNLVLDLKKSVRVRVASYPSHMQEPKFPARLVVDLVE